MNTASKSGSLQAAQAIGASIKTLLGPSTCVKCCVGDECDDVIICSSTVKILQYLDVKHPSWFVINDACEAMYKTYGCGCKTLVCMIGFWSREAAILQHEGVPVPIITKLFEEALTGCNKVLEEIAVPLKDIKENLLDSFASASGSTSPAKTNNMVERLQSVNSVGQCLLSKSVPPGDIQFGRCSTISCRGDLSHDIQAKDNHQITIKNLHGIVKQIHHEKEKDEFDDCFDNPIDDDHSLTSCFVPASQLKTSSQPAASSEKVFMSSKSANCSLNKLELKKTDELLKKLSLSGLNLKSSKPQRNYSQFVKGCRNLLSDSPKTVAKNTGLTASKHKGFELANKEDLKILGKMLSHGKEKEMMLAIDVVFAQIVTKKTNLGRFEVDKNCINIETIVGPSCDNSQVIDGILVQGSSSQLLQLPGEVHVALVNGDVTEEFRHAGFKDSFQARQVIGKTHDNGLYSGHNQSWLGDAIGVIKRFNIGALFAKGNINKDLQEFCQAHNVVAISNISAKMLQLLSSSLGTSIVVYLTDLNDSDIGRPASLHHWLQPVKKAVETPFILVKACKSKNIPACVEDELHDKVKHEYDALLQTVLLCAPSKHLLMEAELAFWNCVFRLRNSINQGCVLPGAGQTELACVKMIRNLAGKGETQDSKPPKSSNWLTLSLPSYRQAVYTAFADGLIEFITTILSNTGQAVHHGQALTTVHKVLQGEYQDSLHCISEEVSGGHSIVSDDFVTKLNAWHRAVGVVCLLIQSDMIIETGMDNRKNKIS